MKADAKGRLSIVATPIGHLEDITLRALATLKAADLVLAEDTRHTLKLLRHYGIATKLRALHAHSSDAVMQRCLSDLAQGQHLALVSDAGTPLVSDPGAALVYAAAEREIAIESIPGPSAVIAALTVAALPFDAFVFVGFAPRSGARRKQWLQSIAQSEDASVFFESPQRIATTLRELAVLLHPHRQLAVCRELTKLHEEIVRGNADALAERFAEGARGEITVVVGSGAVAAIQAIEPAPLEGRIVELLTNGLSIRDVARQLARETGKSRREIYARAQKVSELSGSRRG